MTTITILFLAVILTVVNIWLLIARKPNYIVAFIAGASWIAFLAYTRANPMSGMATGSTTDEILVIICLAMVIAMPLVTFFSVRESNMAEFKKRSNALSSYREERETRHGTRGNFAESPEEYQARVRGILRHKKR